MRTLLRHPDFVTVASVAVAAGVLLGFVGWPPADRNFEFFALILTAAFVSAVATPLPSIEDAGTMPLSFIVDFTSLLLLGPHATMLVAAASAATRGLIDAHHPQRILGGAAVAMFSIQTAGVVFGLLGGSSGQFGWPWQAIPIGAAIVAYTIVSRWSTNVVAALLMHKRGPKLDPFSGWPTYVVGGSIAAGLALLLEYRLWPALPVVAIPLFIAAKAYADYATRLEDERRRREVIESLDQGMAVVDSTGVVTLWNDALERIVACPRQYAMGRPLVDVLPTLKSTDFAAAIREALADANPRTLTHVGLPTADGARVLQVKIIPVVDGLTLLWQDVAERTRAEQALKRTEERLALAAEGANDGLWEWDLRSNEFYFSSRWKAMLGLRSPAGIGRPEEWINRVHDDDILALRESLEAYVSGKTEHFEHEHRIRHEDSSYRRFLCRGVAVRGADRRPIRIAGSLTDTTDRAKEQEQLRSAGFRDPLTGLCNRVVFVERLGRRLAEFKQRRGDRFAVLYLDLDRFKIVNDSLGHLVGDELLIAVSRRLESCLRPRDSLARLGGDEFAILLNGLVDEQQANAIAFRIQEALSAPFSVGGREVFSTASIGIAPGLQEYTHPEEIMRDADTAMYHAKGRGKARHELFDADMHARARDRLGLENDLRHAVSNQDFEVHYQPIVSLGPDRCIGFESLVRWTRNGEPIPPISFIPIAEELGLIEAIGTWVMQQACLSFASWQRRFPDAGLQYITVNVSSRQLMQQNFLRIVEEAVEESGLKAADLRIEITETALMDSPNVVAEVLSELRNFGVKIYLDDFGTGFSSLSHLHKLPVDALKIDRSFVKSLLVPDRPATVESILALARTLNTSVVAEGIETEMQARELERLGCTHAQGFLFARPMSVSAVESMLIANKPLGPRRTQAVSVSSMRHEKDADLFFASKPFEWPDDLAAR
jgi:diguanylate cyclase (GGDEF)-like protein/PAS domain S-box-containing protein